MSSLKTPPRAIFRQIQANLGDRYRSGFPVLKELIQNAEDAEATVIRFVSHPGWAAATNPLLRVPGFVVANDGRFEAKDARGILSFADTAKGDEAAAIGRFGFGQKAVFHLCDAFVAHSLGHAVRFSEVVNPCLDVIENTKAGSWDTIDAGDVVLLETATGGITRGFVLWLPLRCEAVLPAPKLFFRDYRPTGAELLDDLMRHEVDLRLILAGMRHLDRIEAFDGATLRLALRRGTDSQRLLGPPAEDREPLLQGSRAIAGVIDGDTARATRYAGREAYGGSARLKGLTQADNWPQVPVFTAEGEVLQPEKAAEHGAIVVVESHDPAARGVSLDWGVFLPVADAANLPADLPALRIMLHGYFFVDSGRQYIEGFASDPAVAGTGTTRTIYQAWNETLRDDLVLPLLPGVLHDALQQQMLTSVQLAEVTRALRLSPFGRQHRAAIAARDVLARRVKPAARGAGGVANWELLPSEAGLRPLPAPSERGDVAIAELLPELCGWAERRGVELIAGPEATLTQAEAGWEPAEIADLLAGLAPDVFLQGGRTAVLATFVDIAVGGDSARQEAAAEPLLAALRPALTATRALAPGEAIASVLAHLPAEAAIALPASAGERPVLAALASASGAPLCLRREWLAEGAARQALSPAEAAPLLAALQPLLREERTADAAGAAAVALVKLLGRLLNEAASDPAYAELPVLRASDGSGVARLVTLPDLVSASREGRLFRDSPRVREIVGLMARAAPNLGTVILTVTTADLLAEVGAPFAFAEARNEAFARLFGSAQEFGPADARARLLDRVYTDASDARPALRALAAGDVRAGHAAARLFTLPQAGGMLDGLALRLIEGSAGDFLVANAVAQELKPAMQGHLGVIAMDGDGLGQLLTAHADALASMNLLDAEITALLVSEVPDADLRALPIFSATDGRRYPAGAVHREIASWNVPPALAGVVPILKSPSVQKAAARAEKLVAPWSPAAQISAALDQPEPHRLWAEILHALEAIGEMVEPGLRDWLRKRPWLPDRQARPWAPEDVVDLPDDVLYAARQVLARGPDLPFLPVAELAPELRQSAAFASLRSAAILSGTSGSVEMLLLQVKEVSPVAVMAGPADVPMQAVADLARLGSDLGLPGWPLLAALLRLAASEKDVPAPARMFEAIGSVAVGDVAQATRHMQALAELAEAGTGAARDLFNHAFRAVCSWPSAALRQVMSGVRVAVSDGNWRPAHEVAAGVSGIAGAHRLAPELEAFWPADASDDRVLAASPDTRGAADQPAREGSLAQLERDGAASLEAVLARAQSEVPADLLALLVGIVRQTDGFRSLVVKRLALSEAATDRIWGHIRDDVETAFIPKLPGQSLANIRRKTLFTFKLAQPRHVAVRSLAGERVQLPVGALEPLLIIGDGHRPRRSIELDGQDHWLRTVTVADTAQPVAAQHIRRMIQTLAQECLGYQPQCIELLERLAEQCTHVEQTTVEDARARLEDRLPHILDELKPPRGTALRRALDAYDRGEEGLPPGNERTRRLPELKAGLWAAVQPTEAAVQLLSAIRGKIEQFGYNSDRVLFEIFQNADDAAVQHPPPEAARFRLYVSDGSLRVLHWGRQINHPGADAERGHREGWHHDLFNMLLMNLSEKREGVTGRFGLGFKSVHLLSAGVGIASGFVACRVRGGMLPEVWDAGRQVSLDLVQAGRRATVIDVPVEPGREADAAKAVTAFRQAARWLPAMSRHLRTVELTGADPRVWTAGFMESGTPGIRIVALGGAEPGRGLALDLVDETTLFVPLAANGPAAAEAGLPRLWLLAPLAESLASGWLMNGRRFRVDPGRGSLARGGNEPQATFAQIGAGLGARLCELHDLIGRDWAGFAHAAGLVDTSQETGPATFWRRLADLFAADFADPIAGHLHGPDRGFGRLVADRPVLPTGLPRPFRPFLRATDARYVVKGALEDGAILAELRDWPAFDDIAESTVSPGTASRLSAIGFAALSALTLAALVRRELAADNRITPERAGRIGRILNRERVNRLPWGEQQEVQDAVSKGRFQMADGSWREARLVARAAADASDEERLILAFAPDEAIADPAYSGSALALYRFARERSGFQQTAAAYAAWASTMSEPAKHVAVLRYVLESTHGLVLGEALAQARPAWLPARSEELRASPLVAGITSDDLPTLLGRLYPEEQRQRWAVDFEREDGGQDETGLQDGRVDPAIFLERLYAWWEREASTERARADRDAYPEGFHPGRLPGQSGDDGRADWFSFFALAIFRTIGRSNDTQHRNFIAAAGRAGWWADMASARLPDSPEPWIRQLEEFARADAWRIDFPQWRRALVDLYIVARWLPDYVDAVLTLPAIVRRQGPIALSDAWRLSASPLWQRRGLEGAPLTQSLGLGANWLVREAVRHGIWTGADAAAMHPYGWASTRRVRVLFSRHLGIDLGPEARMDLSLEIHAHVESYIGDRVDFLGDLDLPLQIVAHGRRDDVLHDLLHGRTPLDLDTNTLLDDDED